jgi:hypothetical protein
MWWDPDTQATFGNGPSPSNSGGGSLGSAFPWGQAASALAPWHNPSDAAQRYLDPLQKQLPEMFDPYTSAGKQAMGLLQPALAGLLKDPSSIMSQIGATYQRSPGYNWMTGQATEAANRAASAGGMLGSPMQQQNIASTITGLANQDYYNYLDKGLDMYKTALSGEQGVGQLGEDATKTLGDLLSKLASAQAAYGYQGAMGQNMRDQGMWGGIGSMLGGLFGGGGGGFDFSSLIGPAMGALL